MRSIHVGVLVLAVLFSSGCAVSRGSMTLDVPPATVASTDGKRVYLDEIVDNRVFEDAPGQPSTPSLKGGNASAQSADIKGRAIARKRNGYGMAMGDILLENNQTVVGVMRDLQREAFRQAGFHVVDTRGELGPDGMEVDTEIQKFWAWMTPGFWTLSMEAQVETVLTVQEGDASRTVEVRAYGINRGQTGREGNWAEAYNRVFEDYKTKLDQAF